MGNAAARRPAMLFQHVENPQVLHQAIAQGAVKLQDVTVSPHAAIANEIARILHGKKILSGRHRSSVNLRELCLQSVVEGITRLLVPKQTVGSKRARIFNSFGKIEASISIYGKLAWALQQLQHCFNSFEVLGEWHATNLDLDRGVALVEIALHLRFQRCDVLARIVVAAGGIDEYLSVCFAIAKAVGKQLIERQPCDFRDRVPHCHVDDAHRDRALAMAARFLVGHQHIPYPERIKVLAAIVKQRVRFGRFQAWNKTLAQQAAWGVASVGIKPKSDYGLAISDDVRNQRDNADRHLAEIDISIADF